tara:strand:- start:382 stop:741 length:360 start_codon:yes stop_codon:yes gene_type:complete
MSLKMQTILLSTGEYDKQLFTTPCEFFYPLAIHRCLDETRAKARGERSRFSSKVAVSHLLTGGLLALCRGYDDARAIADALQEEEIFLMPSIDLLTTHPDWDRVAVKVRELKRDYYSIS